MADITISLTDAQTSALEYAAVSPSDWVANAAEARAAKATKEIIALLVAHCNANDIQLATGEAAQVAQAYSLGVVDTLANVQAAIEAAQGE